MATNAPSRFHAGGAQGPAAGSAATRRHVRRAAWHPPQQALPHAAALRRHSLAAANSVVDVSSVMELWRIFDLRDYGPWEWVLVLLMLLAACWVSCCVCAWCYSGELCSSTRKPGAWVDD